MFLLLCAGIIPRGAAVRVLPFAVRILDAGDVEEGRRGVRRGDGFRLLSRHQPRELWPIQNGGELAVLYCFVFLYLVTAGLDR
jgi:hypothetical protein